MIKNKDFDKAVKFILKWEGDFTNDPNDPGGETKYGISQKAHPYLNVKDLTLKKAKQFYYDNYWLKAGCDKKYIFPANIIIFDTAVNCGVSRAIKIYNNSDSWQDYLFRRIEFYVGLKTAKYYLRGWVNRVIDLYKLVKEKV